MNCVHTMPPSTAHAMAITAVGCVVSANAAILSLMDFMSTNFEKHHSMDAEEISVFIRMVTLKVLATGCM